MKSALKYSLFIGLIQTLLLWLSIGSSEEFTTFGPVWVIMIAIYVGQFAVFYKHQVG